MQRNVASIDAFAQRLVEAVVAWDAQAAPLDANAAVFFDVSVFPIDAEAGSEPVLVARSVRYALR